MIQRLVATSWAAVWAVGAPPRAAAQQLVHELAVVRELRIDAASENLSGINYMSVSRDGVIAVVQSHDRKVLFFSPLGKRLGEFGRNGEGPGDFRAPFFLGWRGDTLWVDDGTLSRTTYISPARKLVRMVPHAPAAGDARPDRGGCVIRYNGQVLGNPWCASPANAASPDSSWTALISQANPVSATAQLTLTVKNKKGEREFERALTVSAVPIPRAVADSQIARLADHKPLDVAARIRSTWPTHFPPVQLVRIGIDGTTWVRLWPPRGTASINYIVLDAMGTQIGTISLPNNLILHVVSRDRVWAVETDKDGLESVVRFRVQY